MMTEPVVEQEPICESDRVRVFPSDHQMRYRAEAKKPDGTTQVFDEVKAHTKSLQVRDGGAVHIEIDSFVSRLKATIPYPYHYLSESENVLCALKLYDVKTLSNDGVVTFALNYNLFCLPWQMAIIVHSFDGQRMVFATGRAEWDRGQLDTKNREVQMFLSVPRERHIALCYYKLQVPQDILLWIEKVGASMSRKGA